MGGTKSIEIEMWNILMNLFNQMPITSPACGCGSAPFPRGKRKKFSQKNLGKTAHTAQINILITRLKEKKRFKNGTSNQPV